MLTAVSAEGKLALRVERSTLLVEASRSWVGGRKLGLVTPDNQ